jgi:hypothetical protein
MFGGAISGVLPFAALGVWAALKLRKSWQQIPSQSRGVAVPINNDHQ